MRILAAWEQLAPDQKFADVTLEEFRAQIAPSIEVREQMKLLQQELSSLGVKRSLVDTVSHQLASRVVASVLCTQAFGDHSPLYHAMGYVTASRRASGLVRKSSRS